MESTIVLTGNVGNDIELRQTRSGHPMVNLRVATTPSLRTDSGWVDAETIWMTVVCYRGLADNVARSIAKGDPVIVEGRVRTQTWKDDEGMQRERIVVEATGIGHDLNRGTSRFTRSSLRVVPAPVSEPGEPDEEYPGETDLIGPGGEVLAA